MRRGLLVVASGLSLVGVLSLGAKTANAGGFEIPENGTELMGRAGAWTARADNPLAAAYNPAGLAGIPSSVLLDANFTWQDLCFQRAGAYGNEDTTGTTLSPHANGQYTGTPYPKVCKDNGLADVNIVPQLAGVWHVNDQLGLGLAVVTPSGAGKANWPDRVNTTLSDGTAVTLAAPQRYLLLSQNAIVVTPTLAAGYAFNRWLRVGLAFQNSIASLKFANVSRGAGSVDNQPESPNQDLRADLTVSSYWAPGVVLGFLVSPTHMIDLGLNARVSADIHASSGTATIVGPYYGSGQYVGGMPTKFSPVNSNANLTSFNLPQPFEIRFGARFHKPRAGAPKDVRGDFLATDIFDVEVDLNYSHDSSFQNLQLTFPDGANKQPVALGSTSVAGYVPPDASVPHFWKDTFAVRLGGEWVAVPNLLGIRLGTYFQTGAVDAKYANIDFLPSQQFGLYAGATVRLAPRIDLSAGFGKIFLATVDNGGNGGVYGLSANTQTSCPSGATPQAFRTCEPVNGGAVSGGYTMFSLGVSAKL
jgi:long-subunit fatty acid transport protein